MTDVNDRLAVINALSSRIGAWFTTWWYPDHVEASALGHPWRRIPYGDGLLQALNAAGRPYRFTMRRKVRKVYRV